MTTSYSADVVEAEGNINIFASCRRRGRKGRIRSEGLEVLGMGFNLEVRRSKVTGSTRRSRGQLKDRGRVGEKILNVYYLPMKEKINRLSNDT